MPASAVQNGPELWADPQLAHLGHFVTLPHPEGGETVVEGVRAHLSRTPGCVARTAPTFGRDIQEILGGILGYDDERMAELVIQGVLE